MTASVLWYVHDHGSGHLARARAVVPLLGAPVVLAAGPGIDLDASATLGAPLVALPSDVPPDAVATIGPWHHAPASAEVRARSLALVAAIEAWRCTTVVVDVSMEVTALARLLGLRVITVRQSGRRDDRAHRLGFASADVVWVPQHRDLEPTAGEDVDDRWSFTGPFSRFDGCLRRVQRTEGCPRTAVLLTGRGGTTLDGARWRGVTPPCGWAVVIAGLDEQWRDGDVSSIGRIDQIGPLLAAADVVVTAAGWAAVADTVSAGARAVVVAERRPFDEQAVRAVALDDAGLVVRADRWPEPSDLPTLLDRALALDPQRWHRYHDGQGAARAAALVDRVHGT